MQKLHAYEASLFLLVCAFGALLSLLVYEKMGYHFADPMLFWDQHISAYFYQLRSEALNEFFLFLTVFANESVGWTIALFTTLFLYFRNRHLLVPFVSMVAFSALSVVFLKLLVARTRPDEDIAYYILQSFSFPSGHATLSLVLYGFLAYLATTYTNLRSAKIVIAAIAAIFILLIGVSRVYLGVHFASDVVAGFLLGSIWLLLGIHFCRVHLPKR